MYIYKSKVLTVTTSSHSTSETSFNDSALHKCSINNHNNKDIQAWSHEIVIFRTEKKFEISGHFSGHQSHKKCVFGHFRRI